MFNEKEGVPALSVAALEKKHHCIIDVDDKSQRTAAAHSYRQALYIV